MSPLALALTALVAIGGASMAPGLAKDRARAERLEAAAATHPGTPAAADELLSAAELYDQRLHDFERAAQLYQRVRTLDGQSRAGQRAAARLERIAPLLAGARGAMAEWSAILIAHDSEVDRETEARASQLLDRYPNWPGVSNVHLWLGDRALGAGRFDAARLHLRKAASGSASAGVKRDALRSLVQLGLTTERLGDAEDALARLRDYGPLTLHEQTLAARVGIERQRRNLFWLALVVLVAALTILAGVLVRGSGSLSGVGRELARVPGEALFVVPVFAIMVVFALVRVREYALPLVWVSLAGVGFTWLAMVALRVRQRSALSTVAIALAAVLGVASSAYLTAYGTGLLDSVADTMREGPGH